MSIFAPELSEKGGSNESMPLDFFVGQRQRRKTESTSTASQYGIETVDINVIKTQSRPHPIVLIGIEYRSKFERVSTLPIPDFHAF